MLGLINRLFQTPRLDNSDIRLQQQTPRPEVDVLGYKIRNYREAGKLGGIGGAGIGAYLASTKYGLIPGLFTGTAFGFILGALGGFGLYALYRLYKLGERKFKEITQPRAALAYA